MKSLLPWIEPLGLIMLLLTLVLGIALWRRRWRWAALIALPWLAYSITTCTVVSSVLLATLEEPWMNSPVKDAPVCDVVVSLGGTGEPSRNELIGFALGRGADRLATSIELTRTGKGQALVLGGGGYTFQDGVMRSEADAAKAWIDSWKVLSAPVLSLGICSDTHDEAVKVAALAKEKGWKRILLVTSASHMRRARACFEKEGLQVESAPCNYLSSISRGEKIQWFHPPHHAGSENFATWMHEIIGWRVYRWRGWV